MLRPVAEVEQTSMSVHSSMTCLLILHMGAQDLCTGVFTESSRQRRQALDQRLSAVGSTAHPRCVSLFPVKMITLFIPMISASTDTGTYPLTAGPKVLAAYFAGNLRSTEPRGGDLNRSTDVHDIDYMLSAVPSGGTWHNTGAAGQHKQHNALRPQQPNGRQWLGTREDYRQGARPSAFGVVCLGPKLKVRDILIPRSGATAIS